MKICPICKTQYSDNTFLYCLQDGTALVDIFQDDIPTIARQNTLEPDANPVFESIPTVMRSQTPVPDTIAIAAKRPQIILAVLATMIVMLLIFGLVVVGFILSRPNGPTDIRVANVSVTPTPAKSKTPNFWIPPSPRPSKTPSMLPTANPNPTPILTDTDREKAKRQIEQLIAAWRFHTEMRDLDSYMALYAPTVDYYRRSGVGKTVVRTDKQRAFSKYTFLQVTLSNLRITVDTQGKGATATFDKQWDFRGAETTSGKVQQRLQFGLIDGRWLIKSEKDLKVYYKN